MSASSAQAQENTDWFFQFRTLAETPGLGLPAMNDTLRGPREVCRPDALNVVNSGGEGLPLALRGDPTSSVKPSEVELLAQNGVKRFMRSAYQSCDAWQAGNDTLVSTRNLIIPAIREQARYSSARPNRYPASGCTNVSAHPPQYGYGGTPGNSAERQSTLSISQSFNRDKSWRNPWGPRVNHMKIDCSAAVGAFFASGGLRWQRNISGFQAPSTRSFSTEVGQTNSCFHLADLSAGPKVGDVINVSRNHMAMIDEVRENPFGWDGFTRASQCNDLEVTDFNFVISQSLGGEGLIRTHVRSMLGPWRSAANIVEIVKSHCRARFERTSRSSRSGRMLIARHKGTAECRMDPIPIEGGSCANSCE